MRFVGGLFRVAGLGRRLAGRGSGGLLTVTRIGTLINYKKRRRRMVMRPVN